MGNKDEKTFTDLFSSSTTEQETKTQTFSDLLKESSIDEEPIEEKQSLTFDNIFDRIPENKTEEESITTIDETNNLDFNSIFTEINEPAVNEENIFSIPEDSNKIDESLNSNEEIVSQEITFEPFPEENSEEDSNPTSETNVIEPNIYEEEVITDENSPTENNDNQRFNDNNIEETQNDNLDFSNNLFFDNNDAKILKEDAPIIDEEAQINNTIASNPFFEQNTSESSATDTLEISEKNPFFDNCNPEEHNTEKNEKDNSSVSSNIFFENVEMKPIEDSRTNMVDETKNDIIDNPFFVDDNSKNYDPSISKIPENNPFFEENTTTGNNTSIPSSQSVNSSNEDIAPKSTSPFFEMEKKSEENPFFQNQINLIENQIPNNPSNGIDTSKSKHYNVKIVKKKEPLIKVILGVLSYALFIWLLLIGTTLLVYVLDIKIRAAKGDYSSPTFNAYVVLTGSMLPEIQVKDVVVTKKVDAKDLKERDVITFASADSRFAGTIITHRIIKKNPPSDNQGYTFQTKGDNNNVADSALVPEANIYGKVILKIPKLGYLQEFLASDGGWIIVILIPCLTVMSYDIVKLIKGMKRKKYKNIKVQK